MVAGLSIVTSVPSRVELLLKEAFCNKCRYKR